MRKKVRLVKPKRWPDSRIPPAVKRVRDLPEVEATLSLLYDRHPPIVMRWNKDIWMPNSPRLSPMFHARVCTPSEVLAPERTPIGPRQILWGRKLINIGKKPRKKSAEAVKDLRRRSR
jgi:hypothetical protein